MVCATRQAVDDRAYWINLASLDRTACGIFLLSSLNPSIGRPGDRCVNFVTHLRGRDRPLRSASWENVYFAGNYRTFPSIVSTGTALASGLEAGRAVLADLGARTELPAQAAGFRLAAMPRA